MTSGWLVLCVLFLLPLCCPAAPHQQRALNFSQSLRLTRKIHASVHDLLLQYKEEQFGDRGYEDHTLVLKSLPSFHMEYSQWISLQDWEHLSTASKYLHMFCDHLDRRRKQMEKFWKKRTNSKKAGYLIQAMLRIQRNLQDLIGQVNSQLRSLDITSLPPASSSPAPKVQTPPTYLPLTQDLWSSGQQGYIILRDLERYLSKLARDFLFLNARHRGRPAGPKHNHPM